MMFALILICLIVIGIAEYYGTSDWTWIAQQNARVVLVLIVLGFALIALVGWIKARR